MSVATITIEDEPGDVVRLNVHYGPAGADESSAAHHLATRLMDVAVGYHEMPEPPEVSVDGKPLALTFGPEHKALLARLRLRPEDDEDDEAPDQDAP